MTRAASLVLLLTACVPMEFERPETFADLDLGEQVDAALLIEAAERLEPCIGRPYDLDGWTAWIVDDGTRCWSGPCFRCPATAVLTCGPELPPGCAHEEDCPCECAGMTHFATKRIALAPQLRSLDHEVQHAGWSLVDPYHSEEEWQRCP